MKRSHKPKMESGGQGFWVLFAREKYLPEGNEICCLLNDRKLVKYQTTPPSAPPESVRGWLSLGRRGINKFPTTNLAFT
ncbi:MAG: hypothetical protein J0L62_11110 [Bacteroidetes bacterium]|nr:hypothetical protein [Bacteroidota bacterium]